MRNVYFYTVMIVCTPLALLDLFNVISIPLWGNSLIVVALLMNFVINRPKRRA